MTDAEHRYKLWMQLRRRTHLKVRIRKNSLLSSITLDEEAIKKEFFEMTEQQQLEKIADQKLILLKVDEKYKKKPIIKK